MAMSPIRNTTSSTTVNRIEFFFTASLPDLHTVFNLSILSPSKHTSTTIGGRIIGQNDVVDQLQTRGTFFIKSIGFDYRLLRLQPSGIHSSTVGFGPSILRLFAKTFDQMMGQT
jgi:hypothetical protein